MGVSVHYTQLLIQAGWYNVLIWIISHRQGKVKRIPAVQKSSTIIAFAWIERFICSFLYLTMNKSMWPSNEFVTSVMLLSVR